MKIMTIVKKNAKWIGAITFLLVCFVIGQLTHKDTVVVDNPGNNNVNSDNNIADSAEVFNSCIITGYVNNQATGDNPWGYTAGIIDMEDGSKAVLLNPDTGLNIIPNDEYFGNDIVLEYCIHPWVCESSDGTEMTVNMLDDKSKVISTEVYQVDNSGNWNELTINIPKEVSTLTINCNAIKGKEACDWLLVREKKAKDAADDNNENNYAENTFDIIYSNAVPNVEYETIIASIKKNDNPVIEQGANNSFDCSDVLNPSVIKYNDLYYNYYSGWDGKVWKTGLATSQDGINWTKEDNSILDIRENEWDNHYIAANGSAVVHNDSVYYYYHGFNKETNKPEIGLAISKDGKVFDQRTLEPVLKVGNAGSFDESGVADPYVIAFGDKLYMYYLGMDRMGTQKLGVAYSVDGVNWVKNSANPIMDVGVAGAFDENGLGEPSVIYKEPYFYMLYTGRNAKEERNIGLAVSLDGVHFKKYNYNGIFDLSKNVWDNQVMCDTTMLELDNGHIGVWYGGGNVASPDENLNGKIGYFEVELPGISNIVGFDPTNDYDENGYYKGTTIPSTDIVKGSYSVEKDGELKYVWLSKETSLVLSKSQGQKYVCIKGYVPMDMYKQAGVKELTLTVSVNGDEVYSEQYTEAKQIEWKIPVEKYNSPMNLTIKASECVNGKSKGISEDARDLSVILNKVWME